MENGINLDGTVEIAIALTEEELDDFISNIDNHDTCSQLYLGHDILMDAQQAQALQDRNITVEVVPGYFYKELEG